MHVCAVFDRSTKLTTFESQVSYECILVGTQEQRRLSNSGNDFWNPYTNQHRKVNRAPGMDAVTATICHVDDKVVASLDNVSKNPLRKQPKRG